MPMSVGGQKPSNKIVRRLARTGILTANLPSAGIVAVARPTSTPPTVAVNSASPGANS